MVLYNEQLEEEKGIMPFLGQLGQICTIHPEDVAEDDVSSFSDRTLGTGGTEASEKGSLQESTSGCIAEGGR